MMKKALVIEDNENNMELISFILELNDFKVIKAFRGEEGYELACSEEPDFVILDIQLPDIDGLQVLARLKENEVTRVLPVIAMTSYAMTGDERKILSAGCNGYIEKPIDPNNVIMQINKVLETQA